MFGVGCVRGVANTGRRAVRGTFLWRTPARLGNGFPISSVRSNDAGSQIWLADAGTWYTASNRRVAAGKMEAL